MSFKRQDAKTEGTIFDEFEERMLKCEVKVTQDQEMLHSNINQKMQGIDNLLFDMAARVAECQVVKQQFEIFLEKQLKFEKMFNIDYKTEIITQITSIRSEFLEQNQDVLGTVQFLKKNFDNVIMPAFDDMRETCKRVVDRSNRNEAKVDDFLRQILDLERKKVDLVLYKEEIRDFHQTIDKISFEHDLAHNSLQ